MKKQQRYRTDLFFPKANFWTGAGSVFNLAGNSFRRNNDLTGWQRDALALENDWGVIGQDMAGIMCMYPMPDPELQLKLSSHLQQEANNAGKTKNHASTATKNPQQNDDDYHEQIDNVISKLDYDEKTNIIQAFMSVQKSWQGPLPHPQTLKEYNDSFPEGAKAVFDLTLAQSNHRMQLENTTTNRELDQSEKGQHYAFIIALAFLFVSGFLIWNGNEAAGTILGTIDIIGLVSVFVLGKKRRGQ